MKPVNLQKEPGKKQASPFIKKFDSISAKATRIAGSPHAFLVALLVVLLWMCCGPVFHYSDTWQLFINTGTTIITFLMVFLIQQAQNKDTIALHLKLNELIACHEKASNRLINIEDLTEEELDTLKRFYIELSDLAETHNDLFSTHSLDEAAYNQLEKRTFTSSRKKAPISDSPTGKKLN